MTVTMTTQLQLGPQGRIVIPAAIRQAMGLETGAVLVANVVDGKLVLETQAQLLNRFYARFASARMQPDSSVVDELLAERRAEAATE
jgi:AbrB family looped-hinge helix DNA binding protein